MAVLGSGQIITVSNSTVYLNLSNSRGFFRQNLAGGRSSKTLAFLNAKKKKRRRRRRRKSWSQRGNLVPCLDLSQSGFDRPQNARSLIRDDYGTHVLGKELAS